MLRRRNWTRFRNIAVRELVLLLAKREDLDEDGRLNADKVQAFYLAQGEMIEVYSDTLHFCPCEVTGSGFNCIVGLQRGTNLPIAPEQKVNKLWAANKWLLGHEANTGLIGARSREFTWKTGRSIRSDNQEAESIGKGNQRSFLPCGGKGMGRVL